MPTRAKGYLIGLIAGSILVAAYDTAVYAYDLDPNASMASLWPAAFLVLLILWVVEDSKAQPVVYKPFDFGFLVYLFWLPYLPYYLWRTRRWRGLLMLLGFNVLFFLGTLAQWTIYALS